MLYATDGIEQKSDFEKAMVGVASVWCVIIPLLLVTKSTFSPRF